MTGNREQQSSQKKRFHWAILFMMYISFLCSAIVWKPDEHLLCSHLGGIEQRGRAAQTPMPTLMQRTDSASREVWGGGSTQIGPGTTAHICGTITGSAGAVAFTFQGSGTSGNPVTLPSNLARCSPPLLGIGFNGGD